MLVEFDPKASGRVPVRVLLAMMRSDKFDRRDNSWGKLPLRPLASAASMRNCEFWVRTKNQTTCSSTYQKECQ